MRHTIVLFIVFLIFSFSKSKVERKLVGTWEIYKIEKKERPPKIKRQKFITFNADGTFLGGRIGQEANKSGNWKFDNKKGTLLLKSDYGNKDDGSYFIEKITRKELIIKTDDRTLVYFKKVDY